MKKHKYGLKLWSDNKNYINQAERLYKKKIYDYIELYIVPDTYDKYIKIWHKLGIPFIIHCTHFMHGFNLAEENKRKRNMEIFSEVRAFCDKLNGKYIILHPGVEGRPKETIRQINLLKDKRLLLENKPYISLYGDQCRGSICEELKEIINSCKIGFCLDISHAFNAAFHIKADRYKYVKRMLNLKPSVIHISDGIKGGIHDKHLNIGEGDFDFNKIKKIINFSGARWLTIETRKKRSDLEDFVEDTEKIKNLINDK
jgi:deoxyribonuclease IV